MFFGKIRKRLRKRVTNEELREELRLMSDRQAKHGEAIAKLGDMLVLFDNLMGKHFESLEKNDMAMLKSLDKWGTRLGDLIEGLRVSVPQENDAASEAQVKREWFGEDEE